MVNGRGSFPFPTLPQGRGGGCVPGGVPGGVGGGSPLPASPIFGHFGYLPLLTPKMLFFVFFQQGAPKARPFMILTRLIALVFKKHAFFQYLCFVLGMPSCFRRSHSYINTICEYTNPQKRVFSRCPPLLAQKRLKGRRQVRGPEMRHFR
jgi:hypothetical protein